MVKVGLEKSFEFFWSVVFKIESVYYLGKCPWIVFFV